ncbi:MAG: hypothetical protein PIR02_11830 [Microbacterium enclense]
MNARHELVARVLIEERWAHLYARGDRQAASDLSAQPIEDGGLGRRLHPATLKARVRSYDAKRAERLTAQREEERERRIFEAEVALAKADGSVAELAKDGDAAGFTAALAAYVRAEAALDRRTTEHVPLTRWMRQSEETDVALDLVIAIHTPGVGGHPLLARSLRLDAPISRFLREVER